MSERYIPPEARGAAEEVHAVKRDREPKSWLGQHAESVLRALAIVGALGGAMEGTAHAEEAARQDKTSEKMKIIERVERETTEGRVRFAQAEDLDRGELKGKAVVTQVEIFDEGDPKVRGDELKVTKSWYRLDTDDDKTHWDTRQQVSGELAGIKNPFGRVEGLPKSIREGRMSANMARTVANRDLQGFAFELTVVRALRAIGKGDTPEANHALAQLQKEVRDFQKRHPDVPLDQNVLGEVLGAQGQ